MTTDSSAGIASHHRTRGLSGSELSAVLVRPNVQIELFCTLARTNTYQNQ
jgi:hypothetical protein